MFSKVDFVFGEGNAMDGLVMNADTNGCDEGVEQRRMSTTRTEAETVAGRRLPSAIRLLRIGPKPIVMLQTSRYSSAALWWRWWFVVKCVIVLEKMNNVFLWH